MAWVKMRYITNQIAVKIIMIFINGDKFLLRVMDTFPRRRTAKTIFKEKRIWEVEGIRFLTLGYSAEIKLILPQIVPIKRAKINPKKVYFMISLFKGDIAKMVIGTIKKAIFLIISSSPKFKSFVHKIPIICTANKLKST